MERFCGGEREKVQVPRIVLPEGETERLCESALSDWRYLQSMRLSRLVIGLKSFFAIENECLIPKRIS